MSAKIALIALALTASSAAAAPDPLTARNCEQVRADRPEPPTNERCRSVPEPQASALPGAILLPIPDPVGDITNARGPNSHQRLLAQYAVYASIGNRDGMQIISDQLRKSGVKRDELEDFVDHAKIHNGSPRQPERTVSQAEEAWKLSQ
jgi:hypothetical protein